jgi:hypothetical protein
MATSEIQQLRERIEQECQALQNLMHFSACASHQAIYTRYRNLEHCHTLYEAGLGLAVDEHSQGVVARMGNFLYKSGLKAIDVEAYALDFSVKNPAAHRVQYDNFIALYELVTPFILKLSVATPEELTFLRAEFIREMWEEDFCGIGPLFRYFARK